MQRGPTDEEGTSDVITRLLSVLYKEGSIDRRLEERASMVWLVVTKLQFHIRQLLTRHRIGVWRVSSIREPRKSWNLNARLCLELASSYSFIEVIHHHLLESGAKTASLTWSSGVEGEVRQEEISNELKIWDEVSESFRGHPTWLAGYVHCPAISDTAGSRLFPPHSLRKSGVLISVIHKSRYSSPNPF